jgi:FlaA1/EpsC-like NDP-sugar epimerase
MRAVPGEIWIPKLRTYKLDELALVFMASYGLATPYDIVGLRPGEKLHECMISEDEAFMSRDDGMRFVLTPGIPQGHPSKAYHSGQPKLQMSRLELTALIEESMHV